MHTTTDARDRLHAFLAAHPDIQNADGEQLLALPPALLDEHDKLLAAAIAERGGTIAIDPATGIRELKPTFPGGLSGGKRVFVSDRNDKGQFATWDAVRVTVTARGHWHRSGDVPDGLHNDTICRGCGHHGHFDYILDNAPCTAPATAEDVVAALSGPARHVQPGDRVRLLDNDSGYVTGTVQRIYRNVGTFEAADVKLGSGRMFPQSLEFLTLAN